MVAGDIEDQGQDSSHDLTHDSGGGSAGHTHLGEGTDAEDEHRVHDDVDDGSHTLGDHGVEGAPRGLKQPLEHDLQEQAARQARADAQIGDTLADDVRVIALRLEEGLCKNHAHDGKDHRAEDRQQNAVLRCVVGRLKILGAQTAGEQGVDAYAGTNSDGDYQVLVGECHTYGSQSVLTDLGHKVAVHHIVQCLHQHGDHHGQGHGEDQPLDGHDSHFVFLQFRHKNLPTEKRAAAARCGKKGYISLLF